MFLNFLIGMLSFFVNSTYWVVIPFFPIIAKEKDLSYTLIGLILGSYAVGALIGGFLVTLIKPNVNKMNIIRICCLLLGLVNITYAYIPIISNRNIFILLSFFNRFSQGILFSILYVNYSAIIQERYSEDKEKLTTVVVRLRAFGVTGALVGPGLAGYLSKFIGYDWIFNGLGMIFFFLAMLSIIVPYIPPALSDSMIIASSEFKTSTVLSNKVIVLNFCFFIIPLLNLIFLSPGYSTYMKSRFNLELSTISVIYSSSSLGNIVSTLTLIVFIGKLNIKILPVIGVSIQTINFLFLGPVYFLPQNYYFVSIGLFFMGVGMSMANIVVLPLFRKLIEEQRINIDDDNKNKIVGYLANFVFSLCEIIGPIFAGICNEYLGYYNSLFVFIIFNLFAITIYSTFSLLLSLKKKEEKQFNLLENLNLNKD